MQATGGEDVYVVLEDFTPSKPSDLEAGFIPVKAGQLLEVLDSNEMRAWLVLTLPQAPGEQQVEGFVNPRFLKKATPRESSGHTSISVSDRVSAKSEHFEAETGQEVPQQVTRGSGQDEIDAPGSASSHAHSLGSEGESTGQNLTSQQQQEPLPPPMPDLDLLSPGSQTSFLSATDESRGNSLDVPIEDDVTEDKEEVVRSQPAPPPHADLLAEEDGSASFSISSMEQSTSPPPPLSGGGMVMGGQGSKEGKTLGALPLSMSLQSLPSSFSPSVTPAMAPHKFLGYNPMMV